MRNAGKRKAAAPSAAAASPRATNEAEDAGVSSVESSASEEDYDDDRAVGDSDAEVTVVINSAVEQGSGLDDGAEKPPALENPPALEGGATVVWRKPNNKTSTLWAFFLQSTEKEKKRSKCTVKGCKKPVVMVQATSSVLQHMSGHHKHLPAFLEYVKKEAHRTVAKTKGHAKQGGITGLPRDASLFWRDLQSFRLCCAVPS